VHIALAALAREGWIERIHGAGTYVARPDTRFVCAGIYYETDLGMPDTSDFARGIRAGLQERLSGLGKGLQMFVDARSANQRDKLLPALADAILDRSIQCVIAPTATFRNSPALKELTVPSAYAGNPDSPYRVDFDKVDMLREGMRDLKQRGCRSVGFISPFPKRPANPADQCLWPQFQQIALEEGLVLRPEWGSDLASTRLIDTEENGYAEFRRIWKLKRRPEGLLVFPDTHARGVIIAALEIGMREVTSAMKFVFHRNAHAKVLCPFPVTWAVSDEDLLARHLVQIIEKQFRGETVVPVLLPYEMQTYHGTNQR